MNPRALIGLGSNLGDRRSILDGAVQALRTFPGVDLLGVSSYHETRPIGGPPGQRAFLNAAAVVEPSLDPPALLGVLQEVEARFGRERTVRWGERTLDLDLLLHGDTVMETPALVVPHPRFPLRRFALAPAAEVAPEMVDPLTGRTIADLLRNVDRRPSLVCLEAESTVPLRPESRLIPRVQELLTDRLGGVALRREDLARCRWLPWDPLNAHYARVRSMALRLSSQGQLRDHGDKWLVADFALEWEMLRGTTELITRALRNQGRYSAPLFLFAFQEPAAAAVGRALRPTFVVLLGPRANRECGLSSPVLIPEADDPEGIAAEIASACEAMRG
jgi:2-amino-4-hydroxy-6-hydroxymethyldihydropteridine diphosphokinase